MPSKTWTIMATGTPVLGFFDKPSMFASILEKTKAGWCVEAGNTEALRAKVIELHQNMNRAYALNRDRLKCRICGAWLIDRMPCTQRINPFLPLKDVNRVNNLMSLDAACYRLVNNTSADYSHMPPKAQRKITELRKKLRHT